MAALINLQAPTVFFDIQLMLGSGVAVLALLLFGWTGLLVGAAGLAVTVVRWGHPYELLIGMGLLIWLRWFLDRLNGGRSQQANGRLVPAAIGYWLVLGIPAEMLLFTLQLRVDLVKALCLGLKEAVVSVLCTALGLLGYVLWRAWRGRGHKGRLSARSAAFVAVLLAVSLPGVLITFILSGQLKTTALQGELRTMQQVAREAAFPDSHLAGELPPGMALRWRLRSEKERSTDPQLFARLDRSFVVETPSRTGLPELQLLLPSRVAPVLQADQQAFWQVRSDAVTVVQPAEPLIRRLDYELLLPSFTLLGLLLLLAAALAEVLASAIEQQFLGVIRLLQGQPQVDRLPDLGGSVIRELQVLVDLVNRRTRPTRQLSSSLQQARNALAQTALAITEAIPVGTYTMVLRPGDELARFSFMSERFLEICGLERQSAEADPLQAFACVHPDDYDAWMALNAETFARRLPFKGQCRVVVEGLVRWVLAESVPRDLPDGSTVWEGVISDITELVESRQRIEAKEERLRRILEALPIPVGCNRLDEAKTILFLNPCFQATFGYSLQDLPNVPTWWTRAYPDPVDRQTIEQAWAQAVERALPSDAPVQPLELQVVCRDGSCREVIVTAAVYEDQMVAAFVDVTERKRAEQALEQALRREAELKEQQRLELAAKLRSSLTAAAVAHEINQPLSSILINAQLLLEQLQAVPDAEARTLLRPLLEQQVGESQRIVATIEKMRMLLRNVQTDRQPLDWCEVIATARLYLRNLLVSHGVTLETHGLDQPQWLLGDGAQLQIAVVNLIRNAVEALCESPLACPRILLSLERCIDANGTAWLELRVADNGPGFSDVQLEHLLLASTKPEGSGLGLFVVHTAAQIHGGSVHLGRSADLGGAEVLVRLPALAETWSPSDGG